MGGVVSAIGDAVGGVAEAVGSVVEVVVENPIIATAALAVTGVPLPGVLTSLPAPVSAAADTGAGKVESTPGKVTPVTANAAVANIGFSATASTTSPTASSTPLTTLPIALATPPIIVLRLGLDLI